jgi:acetyltransferase-like isoleucine patch superfamily enzyme
MDDTAWRVARSIGIRGVAKSAYHSVRHTASLDKLILGPRSIVEIAPSAEFDLRSRLLFASVSKDASHVKLGRSKFSICPDAIIYTSPVGSATIGPCSVLHVEGEFSMGDSYINSHTRIICEDSITIGDECAIAWNVQFLDTDRHRLLVNGKSQRKTAPIRIGDRVWIGHDVSIKKGVEIGQGSVIASNSTVTADIPRNCFAAGSPAEVQEENIDWHK